MSGTAHKTAKSIANYANKPGAVVNPESTKAAAKFLHAWLSKSETVLQEVLCAMSDCDGFFIAEVTIKVAQAFVTHGGGDEASMVIAAHARGVDPIVVSARAGTALGLLAGY